MTLKKKTRKKQFKASQLRIKIVLLIATFNHIFFFYLKPLFCLNPENFCFKKIKKNWQIQDIKKNKSQHFFMKFAI